MENLLFDPRIGMTARECRPRAWPWPSFARRRPVFGSQSSYV